jgi:phosphoglycerate dehydrogenase-like enzyme
MPSRLPFQTLDNVMMTPHVSAWTEGMLDRRWRVIADNLDRFILGQPLRHLVPRPDPAC